MRYRPCGSVVVPVVVPSMRTFALGSGSPVSVPVTRPVTTRSCASTGAPATNAIKKIQTAVFEARVDMGLWKGSTMGGENGDEGSLSLKATGDAAAAAGESPSLNILENQYVGSKRSRSHASPLHVKELKTAIRQAMVTGSSGRRWASRE